MKEHNDKLNIPKKIKIGFNQRSNTYTGKLAYVTYLDQKGKIAKETSWQNWRDKNIEPEEYDNIPTEGFVLNKNVGGYKSGWDFRSAYTRVYDPRGFEFEITIPNLLFILQECTCEKGKGLIGEFVYAWDGKDLLLLPTTSAPYIESMETISKVTKIGTKDLIPGNSYRSKDVDELVYIGRLKWHYFINQRPSYYNRGESYPMYDQTLSSKMAHTFYDQNKKKFYGIYDLKKILYCVDENVVTDEDIANLRVSFLNGTLQGCLGNVEKISYGVKTSGYICPYDSKKMYETISDDNGNYGILESQIGRRHKLANSYRLKEDERKEEVVVAHKFYMFDLNEKRIKVYRLDSSFNQKYPALGGYGIPYLRYQKSFPKEEIKKWKKDFYEPKIVTPNGKEFPFDSALQLISGWNVFEACANEK